MESLVLLHNDFYTKSSSILVENTKNLFKQLGVSIDCVFKMPFENNLMPCVQEAQYFQNIFKILVKSYNEGKRLLVVDSQSLLGIYALLEAYNNDLELKEKLDSIQKDIDILDLKQNILFVPEMIFEIYQNNSQKTWKGFKCGFVIDRELELLVDRLQIIQKIEKITQLQIQVFYKESYDHLLLVNKEWAYKLASRDYYEMVDCGVDFIMTPNIGVFELFDGHCKNIKKALGRDDLEVPVLFIPQVFLALFEGASATNLLFKEHNIPPKMLK